jgi:hypothetical protein
MPPGGAGTLDDATYLQVTAYMLSRNGVAPGDMELPSDMQALAALRFPGPAGSEFDTKNVTNSLAANVQMPPWPSAPNPLDRFAPVTEAMLSNPAPEMRVEAAIAAGELELKAAVPDLLALLDDDEQIVRAAAMFALGHIGGRAATAALRDIAAGDDPEAAELAELALEEMLFYADGDATIGALLDEEDEEEFDDDPWAQDDGDLGEYEDDRD